MQNRPSYTIFAGVNGAGKSTFYKFLKVNDKNEFGVRINTDEIVRDKFDNQWNMPNIQALAGKEAVITIKECLANRKTFNQETTLTGKLVMKNIKKAKDLGFVIDMFYVGLSSPELSIKRVGERVKRGGHGIPKEDLLRRYAASFQNLKEVLPLCDTVNVFDNSSEEAFNITSPVLVAKDGIKILRAGDIPAYIEPFLQEYMATLI